MSLRDSEAFLRMAPVGRLGTFWKKEPYVVPLNYVYCDGKIYFHCAKRGRKLVSLTKNPSVCFEVDQLVGIKEGDTPCSFSAYYRSVVVSGQARIVRTSEKKAQVLRKLLQKYAVKSVDPVFNKDELEHVDVVEVAVRRIVGKQNLPSGKARTNTRLLIVSKDRYACNRFS